MTDTNSDTTPTTNALEYTAYQVRDREGKKGIWTRIGSAWRHKDGKGFNLQIDAVPLDGRITLRVFEDRKD